MYIATFVTHKLHTKRKYKDYTTCGDVDVWTCVHGVWKCLDTKDGEEAILEVICLTGWYLDPAEIGRAIDQRCVGWML